MSDSEGKMDVLFEVLCFDWSGDSLQGDFEKEGVSFHVECVNVKEEFTPMSPSAVDAVIYCGKATKMMRPEMKKYIDLYSSTPLRIWLQNRSEDYDLDMLLRHRLQVSKHPEGCRKQLGLFYSQLSVFLTKLLSKLDLNDSKTVEYDDFAVYAEQLGVQLTPQDVEAFLSEYEDEGDAFLTSRGILKWVKLGKRASPVGEIILKVIQAKRLLNGFSMDIKRVFFEDAGRKTEIQGSINVSVGDCDFETAGAREEVHVWSRDRFPEQGPADVLQLSESDRSLVLSLTFPRRQGRTFTQVQDFMCNMVFRLESLFTFGSQGKGDAISHVDYRISDTTATLYLAVNLRLIMDMDSSFEREFMPLFNFFKSHVALEAHFSYESKVGLVELWENRAKLIHEQVGQDTKLSFKYWFSSAARDSLFSFTYLPVTAILAFLVKNLHANLHFSTIDDLPEELKELMDALLPKSILTLDDILLTVGAILNKTMRERSFEKQAELMMKTVADLFDVEHVEATGQLWNFVGRVKLHLPGLDNFFRFDLSAIRRKADDAKRAADAEGSEANSSANDSGRNSLKLEVRRTSSQGSKKASLSREGSQLLVEGAVKRRDSRQASSDSASEKSPVHSGSNSIRSGNITPPSPLARRRSIERKGSISPSSPAARRKSIERQISISPPSPADRRRSIEREGSISPLSPAARRRSIERKGSISSGSQGSVSD